MKEVMNTNKRTYKTTWLLFVNLAFPQKRGEKDLAYAERLNSIYQNGLESPQLKDKLVKGASKSVAEIISNSFGIGLVEEVVVH